MITSANVLFAVLFGFAAAAVYWVLATAISVARWYLRLLFAALLQAAHGLFHHWHGA